MRHVSYAASLAVFAAVAQAANRPAYKELCPSPGSPGGSKVLPSGKEIHYKCDVSPSGGAPSSSVKAKDPESCAQQCTDTPGCRFGIWLWSSEVCNLYNEDSTPEKKNGALSVWFDENSPTKPPPNGNNGNQPAPDPAPPVTGDPCKADKENYDDCRKSEIKLEDDLKECEKQKKEAEQNAKSVAAGAKNLEQLAEEWKDKANQCTKDREEDKNDYESQIADLQDEIADLKKGGSGECTDNDCEQLKEDLEMCPGSHKKKRTVGNIQWNLYCNQGVHGSTPFRTEDLHFSECLSACSKDRKCQGINYWLNKDGARCSMYSNHVTTPSDITTGHQFMAAIPVSRR